MNSFLCRVFLLLFGAASIWAPVACWEMLDNTTGLQYTIRLVMWLFVLPQAIGGVVCITLGLNNNLWGKA